MRPLGAGGMGTVWLAYDPDLDRKVALKLLHADAAGSAESRARMIREAQAMARVQSPHVVQVYDVGTSNDQVFIAMELLGGGTLRSWLGEAPRTWREIVEVFLAAGKGLAAAHARELIHRDFKPDNILVTPPRVCVADFGVAAARADTASRASLAEIGVAPASVEDGVTVEGTIVGTPAYMSPEQLSGGDTDARSDQFSYCVALYEALYGERPWDEPNLPALLARLTGGPPVRPPKRPGGPPRWLRDVIGKGLAVEPPARFASMDALLAALDHGLGQRRRIATAMVAAMAIAASVAIAVAVTRRPRADQPEVDGPIQSSCPGDDQVAVRANGDIALQPGWCFYRLTERATDDDATITVSFHARLVGGDGYGVWTGEWNRSSPHGVAVQYEHGDDEQVLRFLAYPNTETPSFPELDHATDEDWHRWVIVSAPGEVTFSLDGDVIHREAIPRRGLDVGFRTWRGGVELRDLTIR